MTTALIVHGGAGAWDLASPRLEEAILACREAATIGQRILLSGGSALQAAEAATKILEDCPALDAGIGSYLTSEGKVEMDAFIMDGLTLNSGSVAAVEEIRNPITLARHVLQDTEHAILVGKGANQFATQVGIPQIDPQTLIIEAEWQRFLELKQQTEEYKTHEVFVIPGSMGDTVGVVALDQQGNLAAATSTGGTRFQMPGRVGDSPLIGSGGYADNHTGAVSATGHGESLMKMVISKQACDLMGIGLPASAACRAAIEQMASRVGEKGRGGLIAIDRNGQIGYFFNTDGMPYAYAEHDGPIVSGR